MPSPAASGEKCRRVRSSQSTPQRPRQANIPLLGAGPLWPGSRWDLARPGGPRGDRQAVPVVVVVVVVVVRVLSIKDCAAATVHVGLLVDLLRLCCVRRGAGCYIARPKPSRQAPSNKCGSFPGPYLSTYPPSMDTSLPIPHCFGAKKARKRELDLRICATIADIGDPPSTPTIGNRSYNRPSPPHTCLPPSTPQCPSPQQTHLHQNLPRAHGPPYAHGVCKFLKNARSKTAG
ncbi:hypothetical protein ACO22_06146 [Paracoccidioides brasiliensis]|uniref:Uncharacterized protein n=1 Tax=Paracoccidioides brasiliensis TaxID=121759 RepID=A0A1D2J8B2_PARBR|nr:hypothetical protein ACO22_06146 [Paracoccidioides brasiliensis]